MKIRWLTEGEENGSIYDVGEQLKWEYLSKQERWKIYLFSFSLESNGIKHIYLVCCYNPIHKEIVTKQEFNKYVLKCGTCKYERLLNKDIFHNTSYNIDIMKATECPLKESKLIDPSHRILLNDF